MLPNGRVPSDGIRVFVHHEMKIQIMLCIPSMVQSAVSFDLKDHGPWSVTTDYEMSNMRDKCQGSVGVVGVVYRDVKRGLQLGLDVPVVVQGLAVRMG